MFRCNAISWSEGKELAQYQLYVPPLQVWAPEVPPVPLVVSEAQPVYVAPQYKTRVPVLQMCGLVGTLLMDRKLSPVLVPSELCDHQSIHTHSLTHLFTHPHRHTITHSLIHAPTQTHNHSLSHTSICTLTHRAWTTHPDTCTYPHTVSLKTRHTHNHLLTHPHYTGCTHTHPVHTILSHTHTRAREQNLIRYSIIH